MKPSFIVIHRLPLRPDKQRTRHERWQLPLLALTLMVVLSGCGRLAATPPLPTRVPAATALARTFQSERTATPLDRTGAASPTATPVVQPTATAPPAPLTPDPRVRADCQAPAPGPAAASLAAEHNIDVRVDLQATGQRISPLIYGVAAGSGREYHQALGIPLVRWGGNQVTRHNWEVNASNAGSDWEFRNVPQGAPGQTPGQHADEIVGEIRASNAEVLLTIPAIGYVAKNGDTETRSFDVPDDGGPPAEPGSEAISNYDPAANQRATSVKSVASKGQAPSYPPNLDDDIVYQDEWIAHLVKTHGAAEAGGVRYYAIDNEPDLWSATHRDIHPVQMGYDAMLATFKEYAAAIKAVDPSAKIVAPELSGVTPLFFSALDRGPDRYFRHYDRRAHGNVPFLPWFLKEVRSHDEAAGTRSLDVVSVHHYPQGGEYRGEEEREPETNARRLRATQQLWDPTYTDESWIARTEAEQLALIPRLKGWVNSYYPGTQVAITEWNYGADDTLNGGLAIADVLGIFGREGLDMAAYWRFPKPETPGASAFKLYGNYDDCGRHFGDQLLTAESSDHRTLSVFASRDSHSGDVLIVAISKRPEGAVGTRFDIAGVGQRSVQVYQFGQEQTAIQRLADVQTDDAGFAYTLPPYAATLFVLKQ